MLDPSEYVLKIDTGYIHKVSKDDPLRKRLDMREPTEEELMRFLGIEIPKAAEILVEGPAEKVEQKKRGRPKNTVQVKFSNDDII